MYPLSDMLIKIKNASIATHASVTVPASKMKAAVLACLKKEGFVGGITEKSVKGHPVLEVVLAYNADGTPKVSSVTCISKPSRRMYMGVKEIRLVKNGMGLAVLSTPKGILSGREARKEQVGGEILCNIW